MSGSSEDAAFSATRMDAACSYDEWSRWYAVLVRLGPDERRVLLRIADRLDMGRRQYGQLTLASDSRDFAREAQDEALDMAVYLAALLERG